MTKVQLLNGSQIAYQGTVKQMGDPNDLTVIVESDAMLFEAWDLERVEGGFLTTSWKRLDNSK